MTYRALTAYNVPIVGGNSLRTLSEAREWVRHNGEYFHGWKIKHVPSGRTVLKHTPPVESVEVG